MDDTGLDFTVLTLAVTVLALVNVLTLALTVLTLAVTVLALVTVLTLALTVLLLTVTVLTLDIAVLTLATILLAITDTELTLVSRGLALPDSQLTRVEILLSPAEIFANKFRPIEAPTLADGLLQFADTVVTDDILGAEESVTATDGLSSCELCDARVVLMVVVVATIGTLAARVCDN